MRKAKVQNVFIVKVAADNMAVFFREELVKVDNFVVIELFKWD